MKGTGLNNIRIDTVINSIKHVYDFLYRSKFSKLQVDQAKSALNTEYESGTFQSEEIDYVYRFFGIRKQSVIRDVETIKERIDGLVKYLDSIEKLKSRDDCLKTMREMYKCGSFSRTTYDLLRELFIKGESVRFIDNTVEKKSKNVSDLINDFKIENNLVGLHTDLMLESDVVCNRLITYIVRNASKNGIQFEFTGACDRDPRDVIPLNDEDKQYSSTIMAKMIIRYLEKLHNKGKNSTGDCSLTLISESIAFLGKALSKREKVKGKKQFDYEFLNFCNCVVVSDIKLKQGKIIKEKSICYNRDDFKALYDNLADENLSRYIQMGVLHKDRLVASTENTELIRSKAKALAYTLDVIDMAVYGRKMLGD